jgi:hypothetical protein
MVIAVEAVVHHVRCNDEAAAERIEKETPKYLVVAMADAVANPWTVVVHPGDTRIADRTVMGPGRSERRTLNTILPKDKRLAIIVELVPD